MKYQVKDVLRYDKEYVAGDVVDLGDDAETAETLLALNVIGELPKAAKATKAEIDAAVKETADAVTGKVFADEKAAK